jgi:hypothetical protein
MTMNYLLLEKLAIGNALSLDGGNDYAVAAVPDDLFGPYDFSLSFWFYARNDQDFQNPIWMGGNNTIPGFKAEINSGTFRLLLINDHDASGSVGHERVEFKAAIQTGQWYFVALKKKGKDGNDYTTMLNGVIGAFTLDRNDMVTDADLTTQRDLFLGSQGGVNRYFDARLDELILQRKLVSDQEFERRYNDALGGAPLDLSNLLLYYTFNQDGAKYDSNGDPYIEDQGLNNYKGYLKGYTSAELDPGGDAFVQGIV